jgi:hypothetical protein
MTIANDLIKLALRSSGVNGVGQTPLAEDVNDGLTLLNDMIGQWQLQRTVQVIPGTLDLFPDLTPNVSSWTGHENVLLTTLMVRLRSAYFLPPDEIMVQVATAALQTFQSNAKQFQPAPAIALVDTTAQGLIFLALRAAGRVTDAQGTIAASQDVTDAFLLLTEMIAEWQLDRTVTVTPGTIPTYPDLTTVVAQTTGANSAIMWNLAVRIRSAFGLDDNKVQVEQAAKSLALVQANNRQQQPAPGLSVDDTTGFGLAFLALRAAGRISDTQSVAQTSQDMTDATSMLREMLDEWRLERTVRVIPGTLPVITDMTATLTLLPGYANAIVLNLAVRIHDTFGKSATDAASAQTALVLASLQSKAGVSTLPDRAAKALALIQANNLQQQAAPSYATNDGTGNGLVFLALRAAGRVNDTQGVLLTSQDATDGQMMLTEMLDEWRLERTVKVIAGTLPTITDFTVAVSTSPGVKNAIVLNLAVRVRDAFGLPASPTQIDRATRALALIQANNLQQIAPRHGGLPTTCQQVMWLALRAAGRINDMQSVSDTSADWDTAFSMLNGMVSQWQRRRWLVPNLVDTWTNSTGAQSYTVMPGGDFDIPRPDRIESAFARFGTITQRSTYALGFLPVAPLSSGGLWNNAGVLSFVAGVNAPAWAAALPTSPPANGGYWNDAGVISDVQGPIAVSGWAGTLPADPNELHLSVPAGGFWDDTGVVAVVPGASDTPPPIVAANGFDYPLNVIQSREDYNKIGLKGLSTWVGSVFYDAAFPVGRLFFTAGVPISGLFELHISTKAAVGGYATSADLLNLPPEYIEALTTNLPLRIMALDPKGPQPTPIQLGLARAALQTIRTANAQVTELNMPAEFMQGHRGNGYGGPSFVGTGLGGAFVLGQGTVL